MLVILAYKHTRNAGSLSDPSDHAARGVPDQDALARTLLWSTMMKAFPSGNGHRDPKQADRNNFGQLAQFPQVVICPPPLLGHHPMLTSLLDRNKVIIWPMKDGNGKRTFELGPIVTHGIQTPNLPCKQTPRQPTPGPSGTQWLEDLFCGKQPKFDLISTFDSSELTFPPFVEPSQTNQPPIPGPSPSSEPYEDVLTCEPEPEVALTQSMEEPFACTTPPHSVIIIDNMPVGSPLIPIMRLARNSPTYNQP
ncbi:hypothetical protein O181_015458 [Austropuccinia psidii MF-1]|uniref:Uncharacterized protein n=1 Tax=Austropuccinia psidii MF-1 TaxID=1389203 RepID=A0A9Q3C2I4_9BASI|nr:hypothetical protein [Austropuccinia psidii MF-1]